MTLMWICFLLLGLYALLLLVYALGWHGQQSFKKADDFVPKTKISVIIAARNEALNIEKCVHAVLNQKYPKHLFDLTVIDDFSEDATAQLVRNINASNLRLISLSDFTGADEKVISFKKKALRIGIAQSDGELIVTTDADCWMDENWLSTIAAFYEGNKVEMIVAPVRFSCNNSILQLFQSLDFMTMQGITVASVRLNLGIMCNGANLAFSRKAYDAVNGYEGVDHLISGDDYLLQLKIKNKYPNGIKYLKAQNVIVDTLPQKSWPDFFQQRIRWASKMGKYKDSKATLILLFIYLTNIILLGTAFWVLFFPQYLFPFLFILLIKVCCELLFLYPVASFFRRRGQLFIFPLLQPLHSLYIVLAGFLSRVGQFNWKQRKNFQ